MVYLVNTDLEDGHRKNSRLKGKLKNKFNSFGKRHLGHESPVNRSGANIPDFPIDKKNYEIHSYFKAGENKMAAPTTTTFIADSFFDSWGTGPKK